MTQNYLFQFVTFYISVTVDHAIKLFSTQVSDQNKKQMAILWGLLILMYPVNQKVSF